MTTDIHAAFEATVSQVGEFYFEKDAAGEYINSYARTAWIVWQARDAEIRRIRDVRNDSAEEWRTEVRLCRETIAERDAEIAALSVKNLLLRELLAWLDWQGGLGFDKHDRIQKALETTAGAVDQDRIPPPPFPWREEQKIARQIRGDGGKERKG